jgi:hypothetical protein
MIRLAELIESTDPDEAEVIEDEVVKPKAKAKTT